MDNIWFLLLGLLFTGLIAFIGGLNLNQYLISGIISFELTLISIILHGDYKIGEMEHG